MTFEPNNLYYWMADKYANNKTPDNKIVICNEGSSRSSKTWDTFHFIYTFCSHNQDLEIPLEVIVIRRTLKNARERAYADFKECMLTIGVFDQDNVSAEKTSPVYNLFGNNIKFIGLDDGAEAKGSDIVFVNEMLEVESQNLVRGWKMRCRKLFISDWNPKYSSHWAFDWEGQPFTYFSKTTYKNNRHLEKSIIADIESTSPYHLDDLHLPEEKRRPNLENIKNKTVDEWYFKVYGMGERASKDGLCIPNVTWIDKFPDNIEKIGYGMDFGYTSDPTAIVKLGVEGNKLYIEGLFYNPTKSSDILFPVLEKLGITKANIWADSADPAMISDLNRRGAHVYGFKKFHGSIEYGIGLINSYDVHIVYNADFKKEQENYIYKTYHDISLEEPVDNHNHYFDATRYGTIANFRKT